MARSRLLDLFLALDRPLDRRTYLITGVTLMILKYVVDATLIGVFAGVTWTPLDYLLPLVSFTAAQKVARFPLPLNIVLVAWTLPFIWIGVTMSVRRALDARIPPGLVVAFFLPVLNYLLMLWLSLAPTAIPEPPAVTAPPTGRHRWRGIHAGAVAGSLTGLAALAASVLLMRTYGSSLFLGAPFLMGVVSALVANRVTSLQRYETLVVGQLALAVTAGVLVLFALEGAICLVMAMPFAIPLTLMGSIVGGMVSRRERPPSIRHVTMALLLVPIGSAIDATVPTSPTRTVLTSIEIEAPPAIVWKHVVSFNEIERAPAWYFRTGLAYPLRARIDGQGVGAMRRCEFTTGAFLEPITVWDEPRTLGFDVALQPPPLREWSPYTRVYAPHLDGFFRTTRGEFRLVPLGGGRMRLEGRTWYALDMQPSAYWHAIADAVLHAIHQRVLEHVKAAAEGEVRRAAP